MKKIIILLVIIILTINFKDKNILNKVEEKNEYKIEETSNITIKSDIKNFYDIKIGDSESSVIHKIGKPSRKDISEYGFYWSVYNQYENDFAMVGIYNDKVVALYSNSINSSEMMNIDFEKDINYVRSNYKPIKYKLKGNTRFMINSKNEFDILKVDNKYITVFYDLHNNNKVTSYQIIKSEVENSIKNIYPMNSDDLKESFENQMIDLVNSIRYKYGLSKMNYCEKAKNSAVKHSEDMRNKNYFDHKNKNNESPFDRMKKEDIEYIRSGENIAAGQINAIYAHEALMNSLGHRKNILGNYDNIGVGVSFGGHYKIYYTQNFYSE